MPCPASICLCFVFIIYYLFIDVFCYIFIVLVISGDYIENIRFYCTESSRLFLLFSMFLSCGLRICAGSRSDVESYL